jgi:FixJ family two-component response regulator
LAFGCLISDVRLPGISGLDLLQRLKEMGSTMPVIITTSYTDASIRSRALEGGAYVYLTKPFADEVLLKHLNSALRSKIPPGEVNRQEDAPDG